MTPDWFPAQPPATPDSTRVRIWAGHNGNPDEAERKKASLSGDRPSVYLWDELGEYVGRATGSDKIIKEGNFYDYTIKHDYGGNRRPAYIEISAAYHDAICIAGIQLRYPDDGITMIYPEIAPRLCGKWRHYPSITDFPIEGQSATGFRPLCVYVDGDRKQGLPESMIFHIPDFSGADATVKAYNENQDLVCKSTGRMNVMDDHMWSIPMFSPPLTYGDEPDGNMTYLDPYRVLDEHVKDNWPHTVDAIIKRDEHDSEATEEPESSESRLDNVYNEYIASNSTNPYHSADYLCNTPDTFGPHWVDLQNGMFCKMDDKTLWPLCNSDTEVKEGCFDLNTSNLISADTGETRSLEEVGSMDYSYLDDVEAAVESIPYDEIAESVNNIDYDSLS